MHIIPIKCKLLSVNCENTDKIRAICIKLPYNENITHSPVRPLHCDPVAAVLHPLLHGVHSCLDVGRRLEILRQHRRLQLLQVGAVWVLRVLIVLALETGGASLVHAVRTGAGQRGLLRSRSRLCSGSGFFDDGSGR